jgi:hypothetical protein
MKNPQEEPKQETVEEAAERLYPGVDRQVDRMLFINGAKWQAKRMYSEEDMIEYADYSWKFSNDNRYKNPLSPKDWFEHFKNKLSNN